MVRSSSKLSEVWACRRAFALVAATLLIAAGAYARPRSATCSLKPFWIDDRGIRSADYGPFDWSFTVTGEEGETLRTFRDPVTKLVVNVGVRFDYGGYAENRPYLVSLAVKVSDKEEKKLFERPGSSEAWTDDKKGWKLSVRQSVRVEELVYTFTLNCVQQKK